MLNTGAILTRIREVLDDGAGSVRTVASTRFSGGLYDGQLQESKALRALVKPRIEPRITRIERHSASPFTQSSIALHTIYVEVDVVRSANLKQKLKDDERDAIKGLAVNDASEIQQALGWSGNLDTTTAGTATNLVSGLLLYDGSNTNTDLTDSSATVVSTHSFHGIVKVTQATS